MMKAIGLLLLGVAGTHAQTSCSNDSNGDGRVGVDDLLSLLAEYGTEDCVATPGGGGAGPDDGGVHFMPQFDMDPAAASSNSAHLSVFGAEMISALPTQDMTLEMWTRFVAGGSDWAGPISASQDDGSTEFGWNIQTRCYDESGSNTACSLSRRIEFSLKSEGGPMGYLGYTPGGRCTYASGAPLFADLTNTWHHLAVTYDGTETAMYYDGDMVMSDVTTNSGPIQYPAASYEASQGGWFTIGAYHDANEYYSFPGAIDELRIWHVKNAPDTGCNVAIAAAPDLNYYWQFDDYPDVGTGDLPGGSTMTATIGPDAVSQGTVGRVCGNCGTCVDPPAPPPPPPQPCWNGVTLVDSGDMTEGDGNYDNGMLCTWTLTCSTDGFVPQVTFTSLNTEAGWDYVNLFDGVDNSGSGLAQFHGDLNGNLPDPINGNTDSVFLQFTTDGSVVRDGFTASFACVDPADMPADCAVEDLVLDWVGGMHASGHAVFDGVSQEHVSLTTNSMQVVVADPLNGCVGDETGDGQASPTGLANAAAMPGKIALIRRGVCFFTSKTINAQNAGAAAVVIYNDERPGTVVMGGPDVGITIPAIFIEGTVGDSLNAAVTADPTMVVSMHCGAQSFHMPNPCVEGRTLTDGGDVSMVGGYNNGHDCNWLLTCSDPDLSPRITFASFNTEAGWDFVNFYDGENTDATRIAQLHGASIPDPVVGSGAIALVQFTSDGSVTRDGFVATFDCTTSGAPPPPHPCVSGVTITDGGAIDFIMDNYDNGMQCQWAHVCNSGTPTVTFDTFQTEGNWDFVNVYDGATSDAVRVGRFSGGAADAVSGSGGALLIEFTSDGSVVMDGFSATLTCAGAVDPCVSEMVLSAEAGNFALDGGYDNGHDCNFVIACPSGTPTVSFNSFETEANWDFVYVYDGDNSGADELGVCHGTECPGRFVGTSEAVLVRFTSDGSVTRQGFSASYTCTPMLEPCGEYGANNQALPGPGAVITDGMAIQYDQGTTDYTNCVWTIACPADTTAIVDFSGVNTEGDWDFLNVHADVSTVSNCIGPAGSNGGCDNSGDLGRFSGAVDDFSMSGVGAIQYISDWSVQSSPGGFTALLNCQGVADDCSVEDLVLDWEGGFHASGHAAFDGYGTIIDGVQSHQMVVADPLDGCMGAADGLAADTLTGNFADGSMTGKIALIRRGVCFFTTKTMNAQNAGASAVVIYNDDRPGTVVMGGPNIGITIPSIFIEGSYGDALNEAVTANPDLDVSMHCGTDSLHMPPADQIACSIGLTLQEPGSFSKTGGYDNGHDCTWLLVCDDGFAPIVTFSSFETEAGWDFVSVFDGADASASQLANCHGSSCDDQTASQSNMFVRFTSDGSVTRNGFEASYTCGTPAGADENPCGPRGGNNQAAPGLYNVADGETVVYEQGATDYTNCMWVTNCADGLVASVEFSNVISEGNWDFLNVASSVDGISNCIGPAGSNGGCDNSGDLGRYSGSTPQAFTTEGVGAFQFITDWSVQEAGAGFTATLTCVSPPDPCASPVSPVAVTGDFGNAGGYTNNLDCYWVGTCAAGRPTIVFNTFQTEGNWDFVNIYPGTATSGATVGRCHGTACPMQQGEAGGSLTVHFESDGSVTRDGFSATFSCDMTAPYNPYDCTYTKSSDQLSMQDAETACTVLGGHLAAIHNPSQQAAIAALEPAGAWIGFHDRHSEAGCTGQGNAIGQAGGFIWTDGSPTDFLAWGDGEPNDWANGVANCDGADGGEDCTHVRDDNLWNDAGCDGARNYICQNCGTIPGPTSYTKINNAGDMWAAEALCTSQGGHLASIHSDDDRAAVVALGADGAWIGFHDTYAEAGCTGQSNDHTEEGGFVWTDGTATDYLSWGGGEPNDWQDGVANCDGTSTLGEDCSHVRGDGNWNDAGCGDNRAAICGMNGDWIPTACNGGQTLWAAGTFQKNGGYDNGHDCNWLLTCPDGETPTVVFSEFQLEANWDFVTVYNGDTTDAGQVARCSGTSCDGGSGNQQNMLVRLTSDGSVTQDGFVASFSCTPAAVCNGEDMVVDYTGGFHASGHAVFDGYDNNHNAALTADATVVVADPLDGCMGGADGLAADTLFGNFADGSMQGKIALIRRGVCFFTTKTMNAQNAGAIGVIVYNDHRVGTVNMGGPNIGITIPSIFIDGVDGDALNAAVTANPDLVVSMHCDERYIYQMCQNTDLMLDWEGGFHASGHAVFDGYGTQTDALLTADATFVVADPLDGCMGAADGLAADTLTGNFADGSMTGKIALIRRGVCFFTTKTMNAQNAGAIGAVIYNDHRVGTVVMGGPDIGITIPSIFIDGVDGDALNAAVTANPDLVGHIHCDAESRNEQPPNPCGASNNGAAANEALPGDYTVACGDSFGLDTSPDHMTNCVWVMEQAGTVAFTNFVSEGGWDFLNVWSDASLVVNIWGPAGSNGGVDNTGDLGRFSGTTQPGTIEGVGAVQLITDWSYMEPNTGFSATLTC